ncbi:hypothetical protein CK203_048644 [Vitis vinifera]|uniref:Reverse transcriptase zinc-binding domain-containing protein n=1 Tax=Vitis vinifera TaxID=29760 RepID=A0A438HK84_VITVI|nr:hypothetical protein CK203_048644 [Vitis vinifera]
MLGYRMFGIPVGDGDGWTPLFARAFNDWEIEVVEHFLHKIQAFRVQREEKDRVFWTASKCGTFSVKSLYSILKLEGSFLFSSDVFGGCFLCLSEVETVDHLLLHCVKTRVLWNLLFSLFGVTWTLSCTVKETLLGWHGAFVGKGRKKAWQMTSL